MREKVIEQRLVKAVKAAGGLALKFVSPGTAGVPDRLILLPGTRLAFVEVKAPGQKPRPLQLHRHDQLRALGFKVYVVDSLEQVDQLTKMMTEGARGRSESPRNEKEVMPNEVHTA